MKNAAISVLSEICGPRAQKVSQRKASRPRNQTDLRQGPDTSHLRESILTVQSEELPTGTEVMLEGPPLGVESQFGDICEML